MPARMTLKQLDGSSFDVAIIGAGINGASTAQHLAAAGYDVLLVDRNDFGSGATSRSSRLLHCGLRYFETPRPFLDFALNPTRFLTALRMARQALKARSDFLTDQPDRARKITLCFPVYKTGPYRAHHLDLAFALLDRLNSSGPPLDYRRVSLKKLESQPLLRQIARLQELETVASFTEYIIHWPERIAVDCCLDAARMGATIRNHTSASLEAFESAMWRIRLADQLDVGEQATVSARMVLNMAGPWIDHLSATAGSATRHVLGTKGASIAVRLPFDAGDQAISTLTRHGEPFYCFPWNGLHYFGPTETVFEADPSTAVADDDDIAFLLEEANAILPAMNLTRKDIVHTWAGVRPLTFDASVPKGKRSREIHDLTEHGLPNVLAMTAGPVSTYRSAGEEMAKAVIGQITPGNKPATPDFSASPPPDTSNSPLLASDLPETTLAHISHAASEELAVTLDDALMRRVPAGWTRQLSDEELVRAAETMAHELGWTRQQQMQQIAGFKQRFAEQHLPGGK